MAKVSRVRNLVEQCLVARLPVLIEGNRGFGKSQLIESIAQENGLEFLMIDLSVAEPIDLLGLPVTSKGTTQYLAPDFLPKRGCGILFFDEINRASNAVLNPLLTLITTGRIPISGYKIPEEWQIAAACNPHDEGGYHVEELDPALRSRFMVIRMEADVSEWVAWAKGKGLHPMVIDFVNGSLSSFDGDSNPRSYEYLSRFLTAHPDAVKTAELELAAEGLIGEKMARAFATFAGGEMRPITLEDMLLDPEGTQQILAMWKRKKRVDLFQISVRNITKALTDRKTIQAIAGNREGCAAIKTFHRALPPDLRSQLVASMPANLVQVLAA
jgi:hypothetical protein